MHPYKYNNEVTDPIPSLGVVDDIITVSENGHKSAMMSSFINAKTALKKLQLGPQKCHIIHVGEKHSDFKKIPHYVEGWDVQEVKYFLQEGEMLRKHMMENTPCLQKL